MLGKSEMIIEILDPQNNKARRKIDSNFIRAGRGSKNNLALNDRKVSREHLVIIKDKDNYMVKDLGSKNGTYVNGKKVTSGKYYLINSDTIISLGDTKLKLIPAEDESSKKNKIIIPAVIIISVIVMALIMFAIFLNEMNKDRGNLVEESVQAEESAQNVDQPEESSKVKKSGEENTTEIIKNEAKKEVETDIELSESSLNIDELLENVVDVYVSFDGQQGSGTGTIYNKNGLIITNFHVIEIADNIIVKTYDGMEHSAEVLWSNQKTDIAILKIENNNLKPAEFASSGNLKLGDEVIAIGSPFGLSNTVTKGIISSFRDINFEYIDIKDAIQHDADINLGNSGGPLFDSNGKVIGINFFIISPDYSSAGLNFAIPIDLVLNEIEDSSVNNP